MALLTIEDHVAYDKSLLWRIHDAYFAQCGTSAWDSGAIPSFATSNFAIARQHARFVLALVEQLTAAGNLDAAEPIAVLEIGSGQGKFAATFFRALETATGKRGRALVPRLRYVLSDYSENNLREAIRAPSLERLVARGLLTPAIFDARRTDPPVDLSGKRLDDPVTVVIANYVACVTPVKVVKKNREGFFEKTISVQAEAPHGQPCDAAAAQRYFATCLDEATRSGPVHQEAQALLRLAAGRARQPSSHFTPRWSPIRSGRSRRARFNTRSRSSTVSSRFDRVSVRAAWLSSTTTARARAPTSARARHPRGRQPTTETR